MSIPDDIMLDYFKLLTRLDSSEIEGLGKDMKTGKLNPSLAKRRLAKIIIGYLHSEEAASKAENDFDLVFKSKEIPDDIEEYFIDDSIIQEGRIWIIKILVESGIAGTNGEARRLIKQGAIKIDGNKVTDDSLELGAAKLDGKILQKGKRHFRKIKV
jgi:tyrosyl-tRNA synthetase